MGGNKKSPIFSKKIKDLSKEIESTEDFFATAFGEEDPLTKMAKELPGSPLAEISVTPALTKKISEIEADDNWLENVESYDGQLAVDVYQTKEHIVVTAALAGVRAEDIDVSLSGDMITIKGRRRHSCQSIPAEDFFIKECYWGGFSRSIILPVDIQHEDINAKFENGILTITIPKAKRSRHTKIKIEDISE